MQASFTPYAALHRELIWDVPKTFNLGEACCGRWAAQQPDAVALRYETLQGEIQQFSYGQLQRAANRLAQGLRRLGVRKGDRVAIVLPQRFETAVAHMAIYQSGAVATPLSGLFGPEALAYRLQDSAAVVALVDEASLNSLRAVRGECPALRSVLLVSSPTAPLLQPGELFYDDVLSSVPSEFSPVTTSADDAAVLIYTSGTTGPPKGALIPHRALIGNLPGFVCSQNGFGFACFNGQAVPGVPANESRAVFWSPADWAWTGGLMDALLPTLYFGRTIVAHAGRYSPEKAFELIQQHGVTHTFLFPTALKAMMKAVPRPAQQYRLHTLQAIMSAGEAVGDAVFAYCQEQLGITVNEMFGQTEMNYIVGNCAMNGRADAPTAWPAKPGSMGRPYPGHRVAVVDEQGQVCPPGVPGDVAVHRRDVNGHPDPIFFLGYWNNPKATAAKFTGDMNNSWCRTGDTAVMDEDGYLWYQGRSDDVFKAAGYRIGPSEIENCLVKHPAVANAAVVPKPDAQRGALVKAFVVLAPGFAASPALIDELQQHVRARLAPFEYPKEIEFIDALPMTTTGKVQRRVLRLLEEERAQRAAS
ncbi:MAG: acyl-CoA synthetase [Burkholderiales bacterium]